MVCIVFQLLICLFLFRRESFERTEEDLILNDRRFDVDVSQVHLSSFLTRLHADFLL